LKMKLLKRTWAEIDLDSLEHNLMQIRSKVADGTKILGVMKADAYGHGAVPMSRALAELGIDHLAVSNLEEAVQIRRGGIRTPILILGYTPPIYAEMMIHMDIVQEVHSLEYARELNEQLRSSNYILPVHIKLDTGMTRLGFSHEEPLLERQLTELAGMSHLRVEGIFTHFSCADSVLPADVVYTRKQYESFREKISLAECCGLHPRLRHCCNSGATALYPEFSMDMVRAGILLYGVHPSADTAPSMDLKPVMALRTMVAQIRKIKAGTAVSYGRCAVAQTDMTLAVLPIGYADGLARRLSGNCRFLLNGMFVPVVGNICMDMCMVDISGVPGAEIGDVVTVFGADGGEQLLCEELAGESGTIAYEILCGISKRIPRIYLSQGKESEILQYIV